MLICRCAPNGEAPPLRSRVLVVAVLGLLPFGPVALVRPRNVDQVQVRGQVANGEFDGTARLLLLDAVTCVRTPFCTVLTGFPVTS